MKLKCSCCNNGKIQRFSHVEGGVCFACEGLGFVEVEETEQLISTITRNATKAATRAINAQAAIDKMSGYEQDYNTSCKILEREITKEFSILGEISSINPLIVEDVWLKLRDTY